MCVSHVFFVYIIIIKVIRSISSIRMTYCRWFDAGDDSMLVMGAGLVVVAQECRKYLKWEAHEKPLTDLEDDDIHPHFKRGNLNRAWP